jgi:AraC-like DNA-binding protein
MKLIFGAQDLDVSQHWQFAEHRHGGIEVVGVLQGRVTLVALDKHWPAHGCQVLAIPPEIPHSWFANERSRLGVLHLIRTPRDLAERLLPDYSPRLLTLSPDQFAEYEMLFTRLVSVSHNASPQQERLLRAYLEAFLLVLLDGQQDQDPVRALMHEVAAYMQAHLDQSLTIAQVAHHFLISEVTLRRHFRSVFGISPKHYLLELRLGEAQRLLSTSHLSIQEIAMQMGFFDLSHFSSTFRRRFGLSPSDWRAQYRQ